MKRKPYRLWWRLLKLAFAAQCAWECWCMFKDVMEHDWQWTWAEFIYGGTYGYGETSHWEPRPGYRRNPGR